MIRDEVFKEELNLALKRQGIKIKDRNEIIKIALNYDVSLRDEILNDEEALAKAKELQEKQSKKIKSEFEEQCDFVEWFKKTYPDVVIMSIRNHGSRTPRERVDQIREGLHSGAADIYIPVWHLWIEFKKSKGGILSDQQEKFRDYVVIECADSWVLAEGFEDGKNKIEEFYKKCVHF